MARRTFDELTNWAEGANTSTAPDLLPPGAFPRGRNTFLKQIGEGSALVESRRGPLTLNSTPISGSPRVWGFQFRKSNGTSYNLLVSDTGRLDKLNSDTTTSAINAVAFTAGDHPPTFAVANDLCFIVNDVEQKKTDGTTVYGFGISRPSAPTVTATAGGTATAGDWDIAITYYNSATGHESSRSDYTSVTTSSGTQKITVSWSAPVDPQVTHVRVYARKTSLGANAYLAVAGATPAADTTHLGYAVATLSTVLDITPTQYAALTLVAPTTTENNPPAAGLVGPCWHASRLFLHDSGNVYFSKVKNNNPFPESFDPEAVQPVDPDDGDTIVALRSYRGKLVIFKQFATYAITGTDPNSWSVDRVAPIGAASAHAIVEGPDGILYWWANGALGLVAWDGEGPPLGLGQRLLSPTVASDALAHAQLQHACAAVDEANSTLLFSVPSFGSTRNDLVIPFNYQLRRFPAEWWNPLDINCLWQTTTSDDTKVVYCGTYSGQVLQWWASANDGVPASSTSSGTVTSATSTTLTDTTATFGTLTDRYVYVLNSARSVVQRRRIVSNTGTTLTVSAAWDATPNTTFTYVIGGIAFELDTPWMNGPSAFVKKRYEFLLAEAETDDLSVTLDIDLFTSKNLTDPRKTRTLRVGGSGGLYDASTSLYDTTTFATTGVSYGKVRCGVTGHAWRARVRKVLNNQTITLLKLGMQAVSLSVKR